MNVICILSIVYVEGEACVCVVILSKMAEDVTRGEELPFFEKKAFLSRRKTEVEPLMSHGLFLDLRSSQI